MKKGTSANFSTDRWPQGGFALITTLSVLVLLALIAVGLLSLSTVEMRTAGAGDSMARARANAKLGLSLALAEMQTMMGPDMRISARGETLARHPQLEAEVPANSPRAWWVGVSHSDPEKGIGPGAQPVIWLVSGLDPNVSPAAQISGEQPFEEPVTLLGEGSIDTALLTGGQPIEAGLVFTRNDKGEDTGGYAYFVDDNGMKAQLAATNPDVRNDRPNPYGGGVLPGTYDLSILERMDSLEDTPMEEYNRLLSLDDLQLIGGDSEISRAKRFSYTTLSRGILSDVRKGGLKKDLTIAFENDRVFSAVFPNDKGRANFGKSYVVMDEEKFRQTRDLPQNGYIHWEMFKDHYNSKKYIRRTPGRAGSDYLDAIMITKNGIFNGWNNTPFGRGQLGPHEIGPNSRTHHLHQRMPYGDYNPIAPPSDTRYYKHSPVIPILSRMQENAWVELISPQGRGQPYKLKTHVQLWTAQYNPYNIGLMVVGDNNRYGPRIIHYPQVRFTIPEIRKANGGQFEKVSGFAGKRQSSVPRQILLGPGRSHVCAFKDHGARGAENDERLYDDKVRDLTLQSIYTETNIATPPRGEATMTVDFILERPSMMHGANSNSYNASHEVSQTMWAPFAWDSIDERFPGKTIVKKASSRQMNENTMASLSFALRTTREGSGTIRPLVDANIRALMCNTKWDSPLDVNLLAAYSPDNRGETEEQIFQMDTRDAPRGYTYWGAGNDPVDGYDRVLLFDVPREDLLSLGQLQHAGVGRFSYEPTTTLARTPPTTPPNWRSTQRTFRTPTDRKTFRSSLPSQRVPSSRASPRPTSPARNASPSTIGRRASNTSRPSSQDWRNEARHLQEAKATSRHLTP